MDRSRIIVLAVAAIAAGLVALIARSFLGGGTEAPKAAPAPQVAMSEVLVAAGALTPGAQLTPALVRWQQWPKSAVDSTFITQDNVPDVSKVVTGTVVRSPLMAGEPLTASKFVRGDSAGFLAAMLTSGMRAVSISITTETGAGGFILPNDRVDVLSTQQMGDAHHAKTTTILKDIRVLAVDQTYESKDTKTVLAKTATLELSPEQVEVVERAQASGNLSLALRPLGDNQTASTTTPSSKTAGADANGNGGSEIAVIRYGLEHASAVGPKE
jgi:pilus assembly protein CpaB